MAGRHHILRALSHRNYRLFFSGQSVSLVGTSVGGILIAAFGEGWCFLLDAISYIAVIASLLAMRLSHTRRAPNTTRVLEELREGVHYAFGFPPIRAALILLALVSMMGMPYTVLMPAIAATTLHGGAHTLGFLMAASGVGALAGAFYLASRHSVLGLGRVIMMATTTFGVGLIIFSLSRVLWLSLLVLPLIGGGFMVQMASTNTILQTIVEEKMRGRVMSFYSMAFMGTAPFGSLLAGALADRIGAPTTIAFGGTACVAAAAWFGRKLPALRQIVRPVYVRQGILPATADGPDHV